MSRTKHHKGQKRQHMGEDFWSRRAGMGNYPYSTYGKFLTRRKERAQAIQELTKLKKCLEDA